MTLSLEEEKSIRVYLGKVFIPITAFFTAIGFLMGFIISGYIENSANTKMINLENEANIKIENIINDTRKRFLDVSQSVYSDQAKFTKNILSEQFKAKQILIKVTNLSIEAEKLDAKVKQLESIKQTNAVIATITAQLKSDKEFQSILTDGINLEIKESKNDIVNLSNSYKKLFPIKIINKWNGDHDTMNTTKWTEMICPKNSFVNGIRFRRQGQGDGYHIHMSMRCSNSTVPML